MNDKISFHHAGEWTAVYLNGDLVTVGDTYLADEWLHTRFDVEDVYDDAFMRGQNARDGVATTLDEVAAYAVARKVRLARAAELRAEAQRLEADAKALSEPPR